MHTHLEFAGSSYNIPHVCLEAIRGSCLIATPLFLFCTFIMSKRGGGSIHGNNPKVKKRKSVKIHALMVPESDEEDLPLNIKTDYARLVQT